MDLESSLAIRSGSYKFVSVELLRDMSASGREYPWVLSAVALLGADLPAVAGFVDLQQLTMTRQATFATGTRMTLTARGRPTITTETQKLQAENRRFQLELVRRELDDAICSGRILARDRYPFESRMGADATLDEARRWIAHTPRPALLNLPRSSGAIVDDDGVPESKPDAEVVRLALAEVERSGGKHNYAAASIKVLKANPELAERCRHMPGIKES